MLYPKLKSDRLQLRQLKESDKDLIFQYRSDSITNQYQGFIPNTINDIETWISKISKEYNSIDSWAQLAIILTEDQKLIGDVGIHFIDKWQVELGVTLNKEFHKMGYAQEALRNTIEHLFTDLKKHRITASIDPDNLASIKLVESFGFRKEAHFKKSILINGKWVDDLVYALLSAEWKK